MQDGRKERLLTDKKESPLLKILTVLATVSVLGLFLGWMLERMLYDQTSEEHLDLPVLDTHALPEPEQSASGGWESETVKRATLGLPPYPQAQPQALAADFLGPHAAISVAWFSTKDSPEAVLDYYVGAFQDAGLPAVDVRANQNGGYVAYLVPATGVTRTVTATRQSSQTTVFVSNGDMRPLLEQPAAVPGDLPHPESATHTMVMQLKQERLGELSVVSSVEGGSLEEWVRFYSEGFTSKGWKVERVVRPSDREAQVEATSSGRRAVALIRRDGSEPKFEILLRVTGAA